MINFFQEYLDSAVNNNTSSFSMICKYATPSIDILLEFIDTVITKHNFNNLSRYNQQRYLDIAKCDLLLDDLLVMTFVPPVWHQQTYLNVKSYTILDRSHITIIDGIIHFEYTHKDDKPVNGVVDEEYNRIILFWRPDQYISLPYTSKTPDLIKKIKNAI